MDKLILWNERSILNKKIEIDYLIDKENPKVFAVCETCLTKNDNFKKQNYAIERKDRTEQRGGGLAICRHDSIQYKKINLRERQNDKRETIAIKISSKKKLVKLNFDLQPLQYIKTTINRILNRPVKKSQINNRRF